MAIACVAIAMGQPTVPAAPASCNASTCTTNSNIDVCPPGSNTVVSNFQNKVLFTNMGNSGLSQGSVWRYRNIATVDGKTINAVVTIDAISNAALNNVDDDAALDQGNNSIASFFSPRIGPDVNLNGANRRGYVQFTCAFYRNNSGSNNNTDNDFAVATALANINYVHYDIDGNDAGGNNVGMAGAWYRETGVARRISATNPAVVGNAPTELSAYSYTHSGATWAGFAGSICERDGVSRCAQIAAAFQYTGAQMSITFRMGYDYNAGGNIGQPIRQYGSRFGCFEFPAQSTLPVKLLSFTGSYKNEATTLNWEAMAESNFSHYEIERSAAANSDFAVVGRKDPLQQTVSNKVQYQFVDDLSGVSGTAFYYRLRMVDIDGKSKFSNVILIRKDQKMMNGISVVPNPVTNGSAMVKMTSTVPGTVDIRIIDFSGKAVLQQQNKVYQGNNSISINNLDRLQPGIYTMQLINGEEISISKFTIVR